VSDAATIAWRQWRSVVGHGISRRPGREGSSAMQTLNYRFPARQAALRKVHIGVVASGDLEILLEPPAVDDPPDSVVVRVRTSVNGFDTIWHEVLERFFTRTPLAGRWELNDFGATPGVVNLRLGQALQSAAAADGPPS
jgi:malonate decarboxylase delta subunit